MEKVLSVDLPNEQHNEETTLKTKGQKGSIGKSNNPKDMGEFTKEDSVSCESNEEEEQETNNAEAPIDKEMKKDETDRTGKINLQVLVMCVFTIIAGFSLLGILIYLVQQSRKEVHNYVFRLNFRIKLLIVAAWGGNSCF